MCPLYSLQAGNSDNKDSVLTRPLKLVFVNSRQGLSVTWDPSASLGAEITGMGYNTLSLYLCIFKWVLFTMKSLKMH